MSRKDAWQLIRSKASPEVQGVGFPTPERILKVDPLIWGPILLRVLYRNPH